MLESVAAISVFVQVAEVHSFVAAGRALGVSASAVGKRIARLEENLGVPLFKRTTRSLSLTADGERLLERSRRIIEEFECLTSEVAQSAQQPRGRLKVTVAPISDRLVDMMASFSRQYPEIELEIQYTDRLVDLVEGDFDMAIRVGEISDSNLRSHWLGDFTRLIVASPQYLLEHGTPTSVAALSGHKLLHYRQPKSGKIEPWPLTLAHGAELPVTLICNDMAARIDFAIKGLALACLPDLVIREPLADGRLVPLHLNAATTRYPIYAIWPHSRMYTARFGALLTFIKTLQL
ncbi:LysR family transcriptional regulator [Pseudomonas silvicola]|nr:LysR family transcriptional regulator [Pseudomonas silvicola]